MSDFDQVRVRMTRVPFNYKWPRSSTVSVVRELGPCSLDAPIAEAAIKGGYAEPFDPKPAAKKAPARQRRSTATKPKVEPAPEGGEPAAEGDAG